MARDPYLDAYRRSHAQHGPDFRVTLWASPQSQRRRFEVFTEMCFLAGKRVLDAGCSRGDFAAFMVEHEIAFAQYVGVDALCDVIDYAQGRGLPHCRFLCGDFVHQPELLRLGEPQVICISGTLNTMSDDDAMAVLDAAWRAAGEALLFNFLGDRAGPEAPPQDDPARRHDTMRIFDWATRRSTAVAFRNDYFPAGHDATILMRKP